MIAVEPVTRATASDERDVPARRSRFSEGRRFVRHMAGFGCARCAADVCVRRAHLEDHAASIALLQALQRDVAKVHA